jgi:hypothetical protein
MLRLVGDYVVLMQSSIPATRPASDYTARVIPFHPNASAPFETAQGFGEH